MCRQSLDQRHHVLLTKRRCEHFPMTASALHFIGTKQEGKFVSAKYVFSVSVF
jgi:hypothetical protein